MIARSAAAAAVIWTLGAIPAAADILIQMKGRLISQELALVDELGRPKWDVGTEFELFAYFPDENVVHYPDGTTWAFGGISHEGQGGWWPSENRWNWLDSFTVNAPGTFLQPRDSNVGGPAYTRPGFVPSENGGDEGFQAPIILRGRQVVGTAFYFNSFSDHTYEIDSNGQTFYANNAWGQFTGRWDFENAIVSGSSIVPEPSAWLLMILGFGVAGSVIRQRSRQLI